MKLITFLGTGNYQPAEYQLGKTAVSSATCYIQVALCEIQKNTGTPVDQIEIIGTIDSQEKHFKSLNKNLSESGFPEAHFNTVPRGESAEDFWAIFDVLRDCITGDHVALDITHGFRSQPFFASAVLNYLASLELLPETTEIYYGEYIPDRTSPVWDLSPFLDLLQWSSAMEAFVKYGRWTSASNLAATLENSIRRKLYQSGKTDSAPSANSQPTTSMNLKPFLNAMNDLGEALDTLRIPHIITGATYQNNKDKKTAGHAETVIEKLALCKTSIEHHMPPLSPLLDQLEHIVKPMIANSHKGESALLAQQALARQLYHWDRATDASVVIREARVSRYLSKDTLDDNDIEDAHKKWETRDKDAQSIGNVRNDLMHGGWRTNAVKGNSLKAQIKSLIDDFDTSDASGEQLVAGEPGGKTLIVSRHQGAIDWLALQGYTDTTVVHHLDITQVQKGDTVIGTLPIHQAAQIAHKRATFVFLEINIPEHQRGKELTVAQMDEFGAKLQEYSVRVVNRENNK